MSSSAAEVMICVRCSPAVTASGVVAGGVVFLAYPGQQEHLVVGGQAEEHAEARQVWRVPGTRWR